MIKITFTVTLFIFCLAYHIRADGAIIPPMITVASTGEAKVPPTEVVINIAIEQRNEGVQGPRQQMDSAAANIIAYLENQGVDSLDIQTTPITISLFTPNYQLMLEAQLSTITMDKKQ